MKIPPPLALAAAPSHGPPPSSLRPLVATLLLALAALAACRAGPPDPQSGAAPSPQASAEPAPFTNPPTQPTAGTSSADAGPPPEPFRTDVGVPPDVPRELLARDAGYREAPHDMRDVAGYSMLAVLRMGEGPPPPRAPEVNGAVIDAARRRAEERIAIEMSATRARFVLSAGGFVLPQGTELRSRLDRYGHLLLWPGEDTYRVAEPGSLRALLGERRLDVAPLSRGRGRHGGEGPRRLNLRTRRVEVSTRAAKATLELATLRDVDEGGSLVCRMLLDLMSASPSTAACETDEVPLHAELRWTTQGALSFDVTSIVRRRDLVAQDLERPRRRSASRRAASRRARRDAGPAERARGVSHRARRSPRARVARAARRRRIDAHQLDGRAAGGLDRRRSCGVGDPGRAAVLSSLLHGRYVVQWRTFLGTRGSPPRRSSCRGRAKPGGHRSPSSSRMGSSRGAPVTLASPRTGLSPVGSPARAGARQDTAIERRQVDELRRLPLVTSRGRRAPGRGRSSRCARPALPPVRPALPRAGRRPSRARADPIAMTGTMTPS